MNGKLIGYFLLIVSSITASVYASHIPVLTRGFSISLLVMIFSIWLLRRRAASAADITDPSGKKARFDFSGTLESILKALEKLLERDEPSCAEIHRRLDSLIEGQLFDFAQAREELLAALGYGPFARVMADFTQAERTLNRAWSAAVDSYPEEALDSLKLARELFSSLSESLNKFQKERAAQG
ncbi:MAG TPA: hypothetical protein VM123_10650 [archaeon]|nr:hypothetical protein [archaeon]